MKRIVLFSFTFSLVITFLSFSSLNARIQPRPKTIMVDNDTALQNQFRPLLNKNVELISETLISIHGYFSDTVVEGDFAYCVNGSALLIINITNPSRPILTGYCSTPGNAKGVAIVGNYAYVADWDSGLQVVDISDPAHPALIANYDTQKYALIEILDVTDPFNPSFVILRACFGERPVAMEIAGNYLYFLNWYSYDPEWRNEYLRILDISDLSNPSWIKSYEFEGMEALKVVNNYLYVAARSEIFIFDISGPESPKLAGWFNTGSHAYGIAVAGNYAYVVEYHCLKIFNVFKPAEPVLVESYSYDLNYLEDIESKGELLFVTRGRNGLQIYDISNPISPILTGNYLNSRVTGIEVAGDYAYLANYYGGFQTIDVSDPTHVVQLDSHDTEGIAGSVRIKDNYAYVASDWGSLYVFDISDPTNITCVANYDSILTHAMDLVIIGDYAYIAGYNRFLIVNIQDPVNPIVTGSLRIGYIYKVAAVTSNYVYLISSFGLYTVNISDLNSPFYVQWIPGKRYGGAVVDNYAYTVDADGNLQIFDISDPANPTWVANSIYVSYILDAKISSNYLYLSTGDLLVLDITDPASPILEGSYTTPGTTGGIFISRGYVFSANGNTVGIYKFTASSVEQENQDLENAPRASSLEQNYPNPFNSFTVIRYQLLGRQLNHVTVKIYNLKGEEVITLIKGEQSAGSYQVIWDGKNESGEEMSSGIYLCILKVNNWQTSKKLIFLK